MTRSKVATHTSALPARPERPVKYTCPVNAPDGSIGYDRPLENYFDTSKVTQLMAPKPPNKLYDTVASAHDYRFQLEPDQLGPNRSTPRPFHFNRRERHRSLAKLSGNSPDYMGISPDLPGWRPRRSSYEDRRGVVPVTPSEVNTLVPYIPPIDTSMPPPSKEWLDAKAREILAAAQAESVAQGHDVRTPGETGRAVSPDEGEDTGRSLSKDNESDFDWGYETDDTVYPPSVVVSRRSTPPPSASAHQSESESHEGEFDSDTDTDTDTDSDDRYKWSTSRISEASSFALADVPRWIIPRKRPSVVLSESGDVFMGGGNDNPGRSPSPSEEPATSPPSSDDERTSMKRKGRQPVHTKRSAKKPKQHLDDTPARRGRRNIGAYGMRTAVEATRFFERASSVPPSTNIPSPSSSPPQPIIIASRIISPPRVPRPQTPPPHPLSKSVPKTYPCFLDGCTHICISAGDLQRHQQSLRHRAPSYPCLACGKVYTRQDALKRHLNGKVGCKRTHAVKLAEEEGVEVEG
ncbi:hypothetical protein BS17DRAFT_133625 [Gyrodon lividus]|nr:hypothetical protein BS17DRAFT_133625 [Gyrodon lividus]